MQVRFDNVTVEYGGGVVLSNLSAVIEPGTTAAIVGPSGSGKTTLLNLINGLVRPTAGCVYVDGKAHDYQRIEHVRRRMGYVMQQSGLFPHMTIRENVSLLARLEDWSRERIDGQVEKLMQSVDLGDKDLLSRYPSELSGGQRQRVALVRALLLDPPLLLMDEPFSALDPIVRRELQDEFLRLKEILRRTIVLVTHDFAEAYRLADRILLLEAGRLVQDASPAEFVARPLTPLGARFVASARGIADA